MAFPTIPTSGANTILTSSQSTATTTHTFPSLTTLAQSAGDLMIAIIVCYQGGSANAEFSSWGGGFLEFVDQSANSTTIQSIGAAYKFSDGTETGTFTVTTVASTRSAMFLMTIPGAHASTLPEATAKANGTTAAADPAALNPTNWDAEDTLWIAVAANGETSLTGTFGGITAAPANYGNYFESGIIGGDVIGAIEGAVAFRQLNASSEDVGTFSLDVSAAGNSALVIAVRPVAAINLVVADATQAHAVDNIALTQVHELAVADSTQGHTVDNLALTQVHNLVVADATQAHTVDNIVLEMPGVDLVIADAGQAHTVDNIVLTQVHQLVVADATQGHVADNLALTQVHNLVVADAGQAQAVDSPTLTQVHNLVVNDATQSHTVDNVVLNASGETDLVVANARQGHTADNLALTQVHVLVVNDAVHSHAADNLTLDAGSIGPGRPHAASSSIARYDSRAAFEPAPIGTDQIPVSSRTDQILVGAHTDTAVYSARGVL